MTSAAPGSLGVTGLPVFSPESLQLRDFGEPEERKENFSLFSLPFYSFFLSLCLPFLFKKREMGKQRIFQKGEGGGKRREEERKAGKGREEGRKGGKGREEERKGGKRERKRKGGKSRKREGIRKKDGEKGSVTKRESRVIEIITRICTLLLFFFCLLHLYDTTKISYNAEMVAYITTLENASLV